MNLKDLDVLNYRIKTMQNQSMVIAYKSAIFRSAGPQETVLCVGQCVGAWVRGCVVNF